MVADIHGGIDGELEEFHPELVAAFQQVGVGAHQQGEGLAVAELVVAPLLEPHEDRVEAQLRMPLELAEDGDVAGVADLLAEVGGVEDELRLEVVVLLRLGQEAEVDADPDVLQRVVDEAGVPGLVARHDGEDVLHVRVGHPLADFGIKYAAGEFGGDGADEELHQLLLQRLRQGLEPELVEGLGADEVALVQVLVEFRHHGVPLGAHRTHVDPVHGGEIGRVEAGAEDGLGGRLARRVVQRPAGLGDGVHGASLGSKPQ